MRIEVEAVSTMKNKREAIVLIYFLSALLLSAFTDGIVTAVGEQYVGGSILFCFVMIVLYDILKRKQLLFLGMAVLVFLQIEICNYNSFGTMLIRYAVLEIIFIFLTFVVAELLINNVTLTSCVLFIIYFFLAIGDCYVYQFRSIPLIPTDFEIARTAFAVLDHYTVSLTKQAMAGIIIFLINISLIFCLKNNVFKVRRGYKRIVKDVFLAVVLMAIMQLPFSDILKPYFNMSTITWNVQIGYWQNGYLLGSIQNFKECKITKPDGYNNIDVIVNQMEMADSLTDEEVRPDVILILNESYADLYSICDLETNRKPTEFIDSLKNTKKGYFVNPNTVTANSEFEILTSDSVQLFSAMTAFTHFSLENVNSVVRNFRDLGYETYAIHPCPAENYNRLNIYPQLGFENMIWLEDFPEDYSVVSDYPSDEACFDKIIELYEAESEKQNKFIYNLTIQNHGGYDRGIENKSIKVLSDMEEPYKSLTEEYLSRLDYTDQAFKKMIQYFEGVDKPVIICMLGDHGPYFNEGIVNKDFSCVEEKAMKTKATPFVMWSNYPMQEEDIGYSSMIYTMPLLFESAGLPLTGYQKYLLEMEDVWPIVTYSFYSDGRDYFRYDDIYGNQSEMLDNYFVLEYNNLIGKNDYFCLYDYGQ